MTCWLIYANALFSFTEIIGQATELYLTKSGQNSGRNDPEWSTYHDIKLFTSTQVTRSYDEILLIMIVIN